MHGHAYGYMNRRQNCCGGCGCCGCHGGQGYDEPARSKGELVEELEGYKTELESEIRRLEGRIASIKQKPE